MTTSLWLSLTDLGRIYGISAVHCGRLLSDAGLRQQNGAPSSTALQQGLAYQHHPHATCPNAVWNGEGCATLLQEQGLRPMAERNLIEQALSRTQGNVSQTAKLLQLQRTTLIEKINKYELRGVA